jgi:hypothetical protein
MTARVNQIMHLNLLCVGLFGIHMLYILWCIGGWCKFRLLSVLMVLDLCLYMCYMSLFNVYIMVIGHLFSWGVTKFVSLYNICPVCKSVGMIIWEGITTNTQCNTYEKRILTFILKISIQIQFFIPAFVTCVGRHDLITPCCCTHVQYYYAS